MKPAVQDLNMVKGNDEAFTFRLDSPNGTDLDLTTYTEIEFTVFDTWGGAQQFQRTLGAGDITKVTASEGIIRVDLIPSNTSSISLPKGRRYVNLKYDIRLTDAAARVLTFVHGNFRLYANAS